jgi:phosphopantetheinyl transferase
MKLYICEDFKNAKWRRKIVNNDKLSLVFAKKCVCDFIGEKEKHIDFILSKNNYGKPFIESIYKTKGGKRKKIDINLHFSLSHSGGIIICAVACFNIGADCQFINIKDIEQCRKIAERFYSPSENVFLNELTEKEYISGFFKIWTKKEAYIKYTGKGLAEGLNTFSADKIKGVYFKKVIPGKLKKTEKSGLFIYLCCGVKNKNALRIKYIK